VILSGKHNTVAKRPDTTQDFGQNCYRA